MPRLSKELSALDVKRLTHPGKGRNVTFPVGGVSGLLLQVTPSGARSWLLRVRVGGYRREIGLGGYPDVTLAQARDRAREAKDKIRNGIDPVEERKAVRASLAAARRRGMTFTDATDKYLAAKLDAFKNANLCAAIGIIQADVLARDSCTDGKATFGADFMPSQALEHAARLLADLLPILEHHDKEEPRT